MKEKMPTPDEVIEKYGLDKPPKRPVPVERPEFNPDTGPVYRMPEEHMIPLEEAAKDLEKKE